MSANTCIFCDIISKKETEFFYEDEDYVAFKDIRPASTYHYLVVPKLHIEQASISTVDLGIIKKLKEIGEEVLRINDAGLDDVRLGFHSRPFYSVNHLHLHAIAPVSQMKYLSRLIFWPNSMWFKDVNSWISQKETES